MKMIESPSGVGQKAIRCPVCKLLVDPGDYGTMLFASPGYHRPVESEEGFAEPVESADGACPGSEVNGRVETVSPPRAA